MQGTPWHGAGLAVLDRPRHAPVRVERGDVPHPREAGFYRSVGLDPRARAHYRHRLPDGRGLHVLDYGDHWRVH